MAKQIFFAALAALPLFAGAAPGADTGPVNDAAQPAAAALPLAIDYMSRELEARLQPPAKGKPPRPDLPSRVSFSPEHKAALRAVFGTEQPLRIQRLPGQGPAASYSLAIPAHSVTEEGSSFSWQAMSGKLSIDKKGRIATTATVPYVESASKEGSFSMQGLRILGVRQRDLFVGTSHMELDQLVFKKADGAEAVTMRNVKGGTSVTRDGKLLNMQVDMGVRQLAVSSETIDNLHFGMRWRNLDQDTLMAMRTITDSIRNSGEKDPAKVMAAAGDLIPLLKKMVLRGAAIDVDDISAIYHGNKAALKISASMPGATAADFDAMERVMQKLAVTIHVQIPLPMLRDIAAGMAERSNREKQSAQVPTAELANQMYELMLGKAVAGNFAKVEKNALVSTIELKGGNLFVNEQAIPVEPLLALLKGTDTKLPPPDTSKPVAVNMQDRGLEAARLFALNGDSDGLYEMCRRHFDGNGVEKNHASALKWCEKGSEAGPSRNKVLLARLYLDGDVSVRDYKAALKLLQPLADESQDEHAQYLLFRIYDEGLGVAKDGLKALDYLRQAAKGGDGDALEAIRRIDSTFQAPVPENDSDPWAYSVNVAGGYFETRFFRFDAGSHRRLQLTLGEFKSHEKWAPLQAVCLAAVNPSDTVCLRLIRKHADDDKFVVYSEVSSTDGQSRRNQVALPTAFKEGDTLDVRVYVSAGKAYFLVNNEKPLVQTIDFPAELINLFCSTGQCSFNFERPAERRESTASASAR